MSVFHFGAGVSEPDFPVWLDPSLFLRAVLCWPIRLGDHCLWLVRDDGGQEAGAKAHK